MKPLLGLLFTSVLLAVVYSEDGDERVYVELHHDDDSDDINEEVQASSLNSGPSWSRRSMTKSDKYRWNKAIVPYKFKNLTAIKPYTLTAIKYSMSLYEYYTCIRFVPWYRGINNDLDLKDSSYLILKQGSGAYLGNLRKEKAGQISGCYNERSCVHELGHSLGFWHEHSNPGHTGWINVNIHNAKPKSLSNFIKRPNNVNLGYDFQSYMNYGKTEFSIGHGLETIEVLLPDLWLRYNPYYMLRELSISHKCYEAPQCRGVTTNCENDGFLTLVAGKCTCRCPQGLDPSTGCTTILKAVSSQVTMPKGQYGLSEHTDGCPGTNFTKGTLTPFRKANPVSFGKKAEQKFCIHTKKDDSKFQWPIGDFCYYRKGGECPTKQRGFYSQNYIIFYDKNYTDPNLQKSGALPDGVYNSTLTQIDLCCTWSGRYADPMSLPNTKPFILFRRGRACQQVEGMNVKRGSLGYPYEKKPLVKGPKVYNDPRRNILYLQTCIYTPVDMDCGQVIQLSDSNPIHSIESPVKDRGSKQCTWLIKGPSNKGKIVMVFDTFDVDCKDKMEVRFTRPGHTGNMYCGEKPLHPIYSILDTMVVQMKTLALSKSYFNATFKWIPDSDLCYDTADKGALYDGKVNVTRYLEPCLSWMEVTNCTYNAYNVNPSTSGLSKNYCRNPDGTFMPWCYTNTKNCRRNYCDVCNSAGTIQVQANSPSQEDAQGCPPGFKPHGHCCYRFVNDKKTYEKAEKTCEGYGSTLAMPKTKAESDYLAREKKHDIWIGLSDRINEGRFVWADGVLANWVNWVKGQPNNYGNQDYVYATPTGQWHDQKPTYKFRFFCQALRYGRSMSTMHPSKASDAHCSAPKTPDGVLQQGPAKTRYAVGEKARFQCQNRISRVVTRTCLTSGQWSTPLRACLVCPQEFDLHGDSCFRFFNQKMTYSEALRTCQRHDSTIAMPKTQELNNFLTTGLGDTVWIGLTDIAMENTFVWNDGTALTWTSWQSGQPNNYGNQDCTYLKSNKLWVDIGCDKMYKFFCQAMKYEGGSCKDAIPTCPGLLAAKPDMCVENSKFVQVQCRKTCGICDNSIDEGFIIGK